MAGQPHDGAASEDPARDVRVDEVIASYLEAVERGESSAARAIDDERARLTDTPVRGADQPTLVYKERPAGGAKPLPNGFGDYEPWRRSPAAGWGWSTRRGR